MLCATADSINMLILFRVIQGLGGGMLMPLGMTIMTRAAGPARMGRLMAILGVPMLLGPILGPILGGWLIDNASWHWIFLINAPIGVIAFIYAFVALPSDAPEPSESFDFLGMLLLSPGLALFLFGVSSLPQKEGDFTAPRVWVSMLVGVVLMLAFVWHAFRPEHPLLDLRLFKNRNLTVSTITMFLFAAAFFGGLLLVPTYFQQIRGESTLDAGLLIAPQGIGAMMTMPIAGALVDKFPVGRIVPFGHGADRHRHVRAHPDRSGHVVPPAHRPAVRHGPRHGRDDDAAVHHCAGTLTHHEVARGSTLLNITQQIASSVGVAVISVMLTNQLKQSDLALPAMRRSRTRRSPTRSADRPGGRVWSRRPRRSRAPTGGVVLIVLTFIPVFFLPRKREVTHLLDDEGVHRSSCTEAGAHRQ